MKVTSSTKIICLGLLFILLLVIVFLPRSLPVFSSVPTTEDPLGNLQGVEGFQSGSDDTCPDCQECRDRCGFPQPPVMPDLSRYVLKSSIPPCPTCPAYPAPQQCFS